MRLLTSAVFVCDFGRRVGSELGGEGEVVDRGNCWHPFLVLLPHNRLHAVSFLRVEVMIVTLYQRDRAWRTIVGGWNGCGGYEPTGERGDKGSKCVASTRGGPARGARYQLVKYLRCCPGCLGISDGWFRTESTRSPATIHQVRVSHWLGASPPAETRGLPSTLPR